MMEDRYYQTDAIQKGVDSDNGIIVAPTGSGKSHIAAGLVNEYQGDTLILQPSQEILESNYQKILATDFDGAEIYSASLGKKNIGRATYATIGSIIKNLGDFKSVKNIIIDECHLVNAKGGMYENLIKELAHDKLIGMTATPYRLGTSSYGSNMRMLHRTRPKIFKDIIYNINPGELEKDGFLTRADYIEFENDNSMLELNTSGAEFSEASTSRYIKENHISDKFLDHVEELSRTKNHILVFVKSVEESQRLCQIIKDMGKTASEINANTKKKDRKNNILGFENGDFQFMLNVGTLTTGYDFPALDCEVDCNPTTSLALYYQKGGRVVRPYEDKKPVIYDLAGNYRRFGNPMDFRLEPNERGGLDLYSAGGRLTSRMITDHPEYETILDFGKYAGSILMDVPDDYLQWCIENMKTSDNKQMFYSELMRRDYL